MRMKRFTALLGAAALAVSAMPMFNAAADTGITVTKAEGWLESAYVTWTDDTPSDSYSVYVKGGSYSDYTKIDSQLVRSYGDYYRADALGLPAGSYTLKIEDKEGETAETSELTVTAHTREGFAFSANSTNKTASGGYNDDGSVPSDAIIIYLTNDNLDTVTATIYDSKSKAYSCTGLEEILQYLAKGDTKHHYILRVLGMIDLSGRDSGTYLKDSNSYIVLKECNNVTFEGVGSDATLKYCGLLIRADNNVEVRNLGVMLFGDDGISIDTDNENIWVHNNDLFYGSPGSDSDQAKGDGSIDCKKSHYVTISMNHFWDSGKSALLDASATASESSQSNYITYHHNWFDHSDSRHPRIRHASVHIYNNYFDGNAKYGTGVTSGASAFVEANVYRNCLYPFLSSQQGTDALGEGTFSSEAGGIIKAYNNQITGGNAPIYASAENTNDFDAYLASTRDEQVSSDYTTKVNTAKSSTFPNTYNNFDTDSSIMYDYTPDAPSEVVAKLEKYAGRGENADFTYEFDDDTADTSYAIDATLKSELIAYTSSLVSVFDDGQTPSVPTEAPATPTPEPGETTPTPTPVVSTPTPEPVSGDTVVWYAGGAYASGDTLTIPGLTANDTLTAGTASQTLNGITFSGTSRTKSKGAADGTGAIKFEPQSDGSFSVYFKSEKGTTFYVKDSAGNTVGSYTNSSGSNESTFITVSVTKGTVYYAYMDDARVYFYGASFTAAEEEEDTPDYVVSDAAVSSSTVTATVTNNTESTDSVYAAAAVYDSDGLMSAVRIVQLDFAETNTAQLTAEFDTIAPGAEIKLMLWNSMSGQTPLVTAQTLSAE